MSRHKTVARRMRLGWLVLGAVLLFALPVSAQSIAIVPPAESPTVDSELDGVLNRGASLERQSQWGEAMRLYEEALREHPENPLLLDRFISARLHFDLIRRCNDESYLTLVRDTETERVLELYGETLLRLQTYHVDDPNWREVVEHGTREFDLALGEPLFRQEFLPRVSPEVIDGFRRRLASFVDRQTIQSRQDAEDAVEMVSRVAGQQLGVPEQAVVLEYLCGAVNVLDLYSAFLTPRELADVYSQIEGNFVGLGVELKAQDGSLLIVRVIPGSPAEAAGIRANDRIVSVDGRATAEISTGEAADLLQGPAGSTVRIGVVSPRGDPRILTVVRRRVEVPSIDEVQMLEPDTGLAYLKLTSFQRSTAQDLDATLWRLYRQGMRSLVVDLRGNPGGLLVSAVEVADVFLEQGTVVTTQGRSPHENFTYTAREPGTWRVPLVVIIDEDSASAAEIFAGAIRDHGRGTIVGTRSYGKGSVQGIFPLGEAAGGLRLTTARFFSPKGRPYSHHGVEPDVIVRMTARPIDGWRPVNPGLPEDDVASDAALEAAVNAARQLVAQRRAVAG